MYSVFTSVYIFLWNKKYLGEVIKVVFKKKKNQNKPSYLLLKLEAPVMIEENIRISMQPIRD